MNTHLLRADIHGFIQEQNGAEHVRLDCLYSLVDFKLRKAL